MHRLALSEAGAVGYDGALRALPRDLMPGPDRVAPVVEPSPGACRAGTERRTGIMTRGLLLGKFMPPHRGHEYMIDFAAQLVDELTVLVCSIRSEPISGETRLDWMRRHFGGIRVVHCADENPQEPAGPEDAR